MVCEILNKVPVDDDQRVIHIAAQNLIGLGNELSVLRSKSSMNKLATIGLTGEPIAAPSFCW